MDSKIQSVKADVVSAEELFTGKMPSRLRVPAYQRPYDWKADNVVALCRDILSAKTAGRREYPVGTLVLHENNDGNWIDIVDGQQRLTTLCLLAEKDTWKLEVESDPEGHRCKYGKLSEEQARSLRNEVWTKIGAKELDDARNFLPNCTFVRIVVENVDEAFQLFDTQNSRGKPLTPANLLKAYHFHELERGGLGGRPEVTRKRMFELETMWEGIDKGGEMPGSLEQRLRWMDGALLSNLIGEQHLFRVRRWCRGENEFLGFNKSHIREFKGVTLGAGDGVSPCHATAFLRRFFRKQYGESGLTLAGIPSRMGSGRDPEGLDPFVHIAQPIVNGEEFFLYLDTFATAYKLLFGNLQTTGLKVFREFYEANCLSYPKHWQGTGRFSRHVFESLYLLLFDLFGREGLLAHHKLMYRVAYWEASRRKWVAKKSVGQTFAPRAVQDMVANETLAELAEAFAELGVRIDDACKANPWDEKLDNDNRYHLPRLQRELVDGKI